MTVEQVIIDMRDHYPREEWPRDFVDDKETERFLETCYWYPAQLTHKTWAFGQRSCCIDIKLPPQLQPLYYRDMGLTREQARIAASQAAASAPLRRSYWNNGILRLM